MRNNTNTVAMIYQLEKIAVRLRLSLAQYLRQARPWARRPNLLLGAVMRRLAQEHERYAGELYDLLARRGHTVHFPTFPMEFTYNNDLSLEFVAQRVLDAQRKLLADATSVRRRLDESNDVEAGRIVGRLVGSLGKYTKLLEELHAPHRARRQARRNESQRAEGRRTRQAASLKYVEHSTVPQTAA